jgi:hypothetical protein
LGASEADACAVLEEERADVTLLFVVLEVTFTLLFVDA